MKIKVKFLTMMLASLSCVGFTSCDDDDFTASIFDTVEKPLDRTLSTFPLDTFVIENFRNPYNMRYVYKMEDIGTDFQKNFIPASYEKSVDLAVLTKYLWFDVYKNLAGEEFLKQYAPKVFHIIGSRCFNPTTGTEDEGYASGGVKLTLFNINGLDVNNGTTLNKNYFKIMHREFASILTQRRVIPLTFAPISQSTYDPVDWQNTADSIALSQGFVSPKAKAASSYDFIELISNYIVKSQVEWDVMLACSDYEWEEVEINANDYKTDSIDNVSRDIMGYKFADGTSDETGTVTTYKVQRKSILRDEEGKPVLDDEGNVQFIRVTGIVGRNIISQKLDIARAWFKENFELDLDNLRAEVQKRQWVQNADGTFATDENGNQLNKLTAPSEADPTKTLMDELRDGVNKFKALQQ